MEDGIRIHFDPDSQVLLHLILAFVMFGVALELRLPDLRAAFVRPKATLVGMASQFVLLPAFTALLLVLWRPDAGLALGLLLVAACPGGNMSNFFSAVARADVALSVALTAVSTLLCVFLTPFNFGLWASVVPGVQTLLRSVSLDGGQLFGSVVTLLLLPIVAGMLFRAWLPKAAAVITVPVRRLSLLLFVLLLVFAVWNNRDGFVQHLDRVFLLVLVHNLAALGIGYASGRVFRLPERQCRTISIETGIQNAGLGLVISLSFFPAIGEMALVCAWWGVWHIVSGMALATVWGRVGVRG